MKISPVIQKNQCKHLTHGQECANIDVLRDCRNKILAPRETEPYAQKEVLKDGKDERSL